MNFAVVIYYEYGEWYCRCINTNIFVWAKDKHLAYDEFIKELINDSRQSAIHDYDAFKPEPVDQKYIDMYNRAKIIRETDFLKVRVLE